MVIFIPTNRFQRLYTEILGRTYTDSSRYIRMFFRAFFKKGEQLWDDDFNQNLTRWSMWVPRVTNYRKYRNIVTVPPLYSPYVTTHILDPAHSNPAEIPAGCNNTIYYYARGMPGAFYLPPLPGSTCYVKGDRNVVMMTDSGWKPMTKHSYKHEDVEISIFASQGAVKRNTVLCRHVVTQKIKFWRIGRRSRVRGLGINRPLHLRKNGVVVGTIFKAQYSSGLTMETDTTFEVGDILDVFVPSSAVFTEPVTMSLIAGLEDIA